MLMILGDVPLLCEQNSSLFISVRKKYQIFGPGKNRVKGKPCYRRSILVLKWGNGTFELPKSIFWAKVCYIVIKSVDNIQAKASAYPKLINHIRDHPFKWRILSRPGKIGSGKNPKYFFSYWAWSTPWGHVLSLKTFRQIPALSWAIRYSVFQPVKFVSTLQKLLATFFQILDIW